MLETNPELRRGSDLLKYLLAALIAACASSLGVLMWIEYERLDLLAARRLSTPPEQCFAVEDSPKGIAAALAAGMLTIAVETPYTRDQTDGLAPIQLRSLCDFDWSLLAT